MRDLELGTAMEIEAVLPDGERWHVLARCTGSAPDSLLLGDPAWDRLEGAPLAAYAEEPAARDRAGRPRVDIYGFRFVQPAHRVLFAPGQQVALYRTRPARPAG